MISQNVLRIRSKAFVIILFWAFSPLLKALPIITDKEISDNTNTSDWLAYGRTHNEQRYSPLDQINVKNVSQLGVEWYLNLPNDVGLVATPLVSEGILYFVGTMNIIRAVDARSGKILWKYDPKVGQAIAGRKQVGYVHNRGLSIYGDKLFLSTWDGRLIALNIKTGKQVWTTRTYDQNEPRWITGHPKAFKGKVLLGNGGTETGPTRGYVSAYDTETGDLAWRFYIVPGNPEDGFENPAMEMAAKTWKGEWWKHGGGGHAWHGYTYDDELDILLIGTGNGSPWNQRIRSPGGGDNLFLCSIVALDPDTGKYLWHYQTTPGEEWDYNSTMDIVLADLEIEGETVKALMHAPKNGFFYVINRETGQLISAEKYADVNWASHVDLETGRPVEVEGARYNKSSSYILPGPSGAHTWHAMSYSPITKLVYLPTLHAGIGMDDSEIPDDWALKPFDWGFGVNFDFKPPVRDYDGSLQAWDPVEQKAVWEVPQKLAYAAGTMVTAGGIVFQGAPDGFFYGYDASNGQIVWKYDAGLGISAPPITYSVDGHQYISLLVGFGGGWANGASTNSSLGWSYGIHTRRLITFSLSGKESVPKQPLPYFPKPLVEQDFVVKKGLADAGAAIYQQKGCWQCHGFGAPGGVAPYLPASPLTLSTMNPALAAVVRDGGRTGRGMPAFPDISDDQLHALMHYFRGVANSVAARTLYKND